MTNITPNSPHIDFESAKKIDENGIEYWEARELMTLLEYKNWRDFNNAINKAIESTRRSGQNPKYHFEDINKMIKIAAGSPRATLRPINDYKLSRYACYLIAQNGDPRKQAIANAQTYFAIQTRRQELNIVEETNKRIFIRKEVKKENKQLFKTASQAGVTDFGKFNDFGYLGLYNTHIPNIKKMKNIGNDSILDRAGSIELAANLFRITQTEDKIRRENIKGQGKANIAHFVVGKKVRKSIKDIGGSMPEDLPAHQHINKFKTHQPKLIK